MDEPPMANYLIDYDHDGKQYSFEIWASSFEDATERISSISKSGKLAGKMCGKFDARGGPWTRFKLWFFSN